MEESEIRAIAKSIVDKAKATARVKQGRLKRSIAYTYVRGEVIFRQVFWGSFGDNSLLEKLASQFMPYGVPYRIILTELGGDTYEKGKTKQGRTSQRKALTAAKNTSSNIKKLIALVKKQREKEDGEEKE
jgi:hypothetical protein